MNDERENFKMRYFLNVCGSLTKHGPAVDACKLDDSDGEWAGCQTLTDTSKIDGDSIFPIGIGQHDFHLKAIGGVSHTSRR